MESSSSYSSVFRLYNPNSGEHFYTSDNREKQSLISYGWKYEGDAWQAPYNSRTPIYRLYNPNAGDHHYTTDSSEVRALVNLGWKNEGIKLYSDDSYTLPLYRLYNPNAKKAGAHHYTSNTEEVRFLKSLGWQDEGICWYGGSSSTNSNIESEKIKGYLVGNKQGGEWGFMGAVSPQTADKLFFRTMKFKSDGTVELSLFGQGNSNINLGTYPYEVNFESQGSYGPNFLLTIKNVTFRNQTKDLVYQASIIMGKDLDPTQGVGYSTLHGGSIGNDSFPISSSNWELVS